MKVELFLKKINREMIDVGRRKPSKESAPGEWIVSWPKSCCILDFTITLPGEKISLPPTRGLAMRGEDGGGMFWEPKSGAVYRVDEEAYHTMLELDRGFSELEVARRMKIPLRKVRALVSQLKRIKR